MNKLTTLAFTALGLTAATLTNAAVYSTSWSGGTPAKASYTITLSGACSGKITTQVASVSINYGYETDDVTGQILRESSNQSVGVESVVIPGESDNFYTSTSGTNWDSKDKYSEKIVKGATTVNFNLTNGGYARLWPISDFATLASGIKCKDGLTINQVLNGRSLYPNQEDSVFKPQTTVKIVTSATNPLKADYTLKQSFSGIVEQNSLCTVKGVVGAEASSVSCAQPKQIKFKVQVSAQGTADKVMAP